MTCDNKSTTTADKMKSVKAAWDKVPSGPKKDAAKKHDDAETQKKLVAAPHALG